MKNNNDKILKLIGKTKPFSKRSAKKNLGFLREILIVKCKLCLNGLSGTISNHQQLHTKLRGRLFLTGVFLQGCKFNLFFIFWLENL